MTGDDTWKKHVLDMIETCRDRQGDSLFYRMALPGWEAELAAIEEEECDE